MQPACAPPPDDAEELALLRRVGSGDRDALSALYRGYHRRLCRFLSRVTRRADIVEEVINDSFWIVWQKASGFRGDARVSTWIMGIAYRCTLKALRQHGEEPVDDGDAGELLSHNPDTDRELRDWLSKAMHRLPAEQRLVLELAYVGGHSIDEIAAIMQCPEGTVKARMFHARMKLRNLLPALAGVETGSAQGIV